MNNILIVGAGLFGAVSARLLAERDYNVQIIEKANYIGGHCKTELIDNIMIHVYGPHIFHTNNKLIWDFVNQYDTFNNYQLRVKVKHENKLYSFPINLLTLHQLFGVNTPDEAAKAISDDCVPNANPQNFEETALANIGKKLYYTFFYGYTKKQWGVEPKELPASIFNRLPVRLTFDDTYFIKHRSLYQGIPINGYSQMIKNIIGDTPVLYNMNFLEHKHLYNQWDKILYTGPIDAYFDYCYGKLPYRSLRFETSKINSKDHQGGAVVNYTDENVPWTRITEHKHFDPNKLDLPHTIISKEYPMDYKDGAEPFYPINSLENQKLYDRYQQLAEQQNRVIFGGRLGMYKYFDMDQTIEAAFELVDKL